ncbi:hypothetical protein HDV63DRAFT_365007 [Trichoderma sp. SZMC 28014]
MTPPSGGEGLVSYSQLACEPCRKGKRRCDRVLPSCELCSRKGAECVYLSRRQSRQSRQRPIQTRSESRLVATDTQNNMSSSSVNVSSSESRLDGQSSHSSTPFVSLESPATAENTTSATALYFIAPHIFQQAQLELPQIHLSIPAKLSPFQNDSSRIQSIAYNFFDSIHWWMPVISKKGFFAHLLNPLSQRRSELSLLIICMQLCCEPDLGSATGTLDAKTLYQNAKKLHFEMEASGVFSLRVLQAGILIALYELGQAIYPAAYLTVGSCARYATAIGVDQLREDDTSSSAYGNSRTLSEVEERRRAWWIILFLDRFLNIGKPGRSLATKTPTFDDLLPVDDKLWDDGTLKVSDFYTISQAFNLEMGMFSRFGQATYMLSQALDLVSPDNQQSVIERSQQMAQLRRTLFALITVSNAEADARELRICAGFCPQMSICSSTIFLLQEYQWRVNSNNMSDVPNIVSATDTWDETLSSLDYIATTCQGFRDHMVDTTSVLVATPFLAHVAYQAALFLIRMGQGVPDSIAAGRISLFKDLLQDIATRWKMANVYLSILEAQEITTASEAMCGPRPLRYSHDADGNRE